MASLTVSLDERSYPIHIASGLLSDTDLLNRYIRGKRVCIISNDIVAPLYLNQLKQSLGGFELDQIIIADGEANKNLNSFETIMAHMLANGHGRDSTIVALGGGVIGDLSGFAAACYQRGIDFIQVPTTLLSQVDSSVGGKTAVNHPLGKNMIGAFYQPKAVFIDLDTLLTLPDREFAAGMAEVIKYGVLADGEFFQWLIDNRKAIADKDRKTLATMIEHCCSIKADIVARDEKESGVRAHLNLGHTFGHAIEAEQGYGNWLHGEAVAAGMVMAAALAANMQLITSDDVERIRELLLAFALPVTGPSGMSVDGYIRHMRRDKKNMDGNIRLILPTKIGQCEIFDNIEHRQLAQVIESLTARS
ncbi:3-dehydroquinate synthase [Thalassotalea mangrovi]|uniref:3-dehydroquinate synthase n=2 Tax=Thalassotalea mangrovi TaxID=2572245 RepID=A0A4U1B7W9_9GAMM|nr:3-dehydroquinate synthase [Thalassotalea mangrovi]